jgi:hypothetical protein
MCVIAVFKYDIKPGRLPDFLNKLAQAAEPKFDSPVMPKRPIGVPAHIARASNIGDSAGMNHNEP